MTVKMTGTGDPAPISYLSHAYGNVTFDYIAGDGSNQSATVLAYRYRQASAPEGKP